MASQGWFPPRGERGRRLIENSCSSDEMAGQGRFSPPGERGRRLSRGGPCNLLEVGSEEQPEVDRRLAELYGQGRAAWPGFEVTAEAFCHRVLELLSPRVDAERALAMLHAADFYLACACAQGDAAAIREADRVVEAAARRPLLKILQAEDWVEDALQVLRRKLFTAEDGALRIADYSGRGPLAAWVRATATRLAIDLRRARRPDAEGTDAPLELLGGAAENPELAALEGQHRAVFEAALRRALSELPSRERNALRLQALDSLSLDAIGKVYGVNRSTVSRWISHARDHVHAELRRTFQKELRLSGRELESFLGVFVDRLEASISTLLKVSRG